ncbi:MAG TPA: hypothetical protein VE152_04500 [Acidimicrobiales bacterium]|nr:hypothetical protein [Acidimicrobiales bacterium]
MADRNEALAKAMERAGMSDDALATALGITSKSVWRWRRHGVVPRRVGLKTRAALALGVEEDEIWPDPPAPIEFDAADATSEVVSAWAHRADAPREVWWALLKQAKAHIDLLAYAMLFLPEDNAALDRLLLAKAKSGCQVRIALADPDSQQVADRDVEERLGGTMPDRIRTTLDHFAPLFGVEGIQVAYHHTPMYNSVFRGDNELLVTPHLYRLKGYKAPLLHLHRTSEDGMFDNLMAHFERVWADTTPVPAP